MTRTLSAVDDTYACTCKPTINQTGMMAGYIKEYGTACIVCILDKISVA